MREQARARSVRVRPVGNRRRGTLPQPIPQVLAMQADPCIERHRRAHIQACQTELRLIIQPTSFAALTWAGAASGAGNDAWRIGSVLSARPLGTTPQGMLVLQIGALAVETEVPGDSSPLPAQFQVRVLSLGGQPLLEIIGSAPAEQLAGRALRERLPQQNGYAPLLAKLAALARRPILRQLSPQFRTVLARFEQSIRTPTEIVHGDGLRKAIEQSGLFLESALLASPGGQSPLADPARDGGDWKAALLRLLAALQDQPRSVYDALANAPETPPPLQSRGLQAQARIPLADDALARTVPEDPNRLLPQLRDAVHAALARLEVTQIEAGTLPAWLLEIPLQGRDGYDVLQLRIDPATPDEQDPAGAPTWTLGFAIDLPALGPIQGELQLRGLCLAVRLHAQHAGTVEQLEDRFVSLRQRLAASGLVLDQLSCQLGLPQPVGLRSAAFLKATA